MCIRDSQGIVVVGGHGGQHLVDGILQRGVALLHRDADVDIVVADLEVNVAAAEVQQRDVGVGDQCCLAGGDVYKRQA